MNKIEEILHTTYEMKTRGPRLGTKGKTPVHITISVEPATSYVTNTPEGTPTFSRRGEIGHGSNKGQTTRGTRS
jgi:hypothetical protein